MRKYWGWTLAVLITLGLAYYQRTTGPTYPVKGTIEYLGNTLKFSMPRSWAKESDASFSLNISDSIAHGIVMYKRFRSHDEWQTKTLEVKNGKMDVVLPQLPHAGKIMYQVWLFDQGKKIPLSEKPLILRYRGDVPAYIMIPHILFMFLSMLFSLAAGVFYFRKRMKLNGLALMATLTLFVGGAVLGPLVQNFAFGEYWTGWPLGTDLTDNKTALSFLVWLLALIVVWKNPHRRAWVLFASIVQLMVYLIPHSLFGSEIDFTKTIQ